MKSKLNSQHNIPRSLTMMAALPIAAFGFLPTSAQSATVAGVTIQDVSTNLGGFDRNANYVLDGSGFDANTGFHTIAPDTNMWLNQGTFANGNPADPNAPGAVITFDLEGSYDLNSVTVWNYNETLPGRLELLEHGANSVDILVASSEGGAFTSLGNFTFTIAPGLDNVDFGQNIDLSGFAAADDTRLVRFNILNNHGGDNNFVGLSEVRFDAIPEPSSMLLIALGSLGLLARRRRIA